MHSSQSKLESRLTGKQGSMVLCESMHGYVHPYYC